MRIVFMGTPEFAVPSLRALAGGGGHTVAAVVTQPDRPRRSRASAPAPTAVRQAAVDMGLPVLAPASLAGPEIAAQLAALGPEAMVVVAYGRLLPPAILAIPPRWCINLHASLLPKYRGAAPIARVIMAGEKVTGVTTMKMDRGLDTGDILLQRECAIGLTETAGELAERLAALGASLLLETLRQHEARALDPRRQDAREATQAPPLAKGDGRVVWERGAEEIACRIRACNPWPLAFAMLRGTPVQLLRAEVGLAAAARGRRRAPPGQVVVAEGSRLTVQCGGDSRLDLLELRLPGRKAVSARDAINGRLIREGDLLATAPPS